MPYLMTMSLGRFASQRVVNLSILYVDEAQVKHRVSRVFETDMLLLAKLPSLIEELLVGAYGAGGTALENGAFQLRVAQQAYERERRAARRGRCINDRSFGSGWRSWQAPVVLR